MILNSSNGNNKCEFHNGFADPDGQEDGKLMPGCQGLLCRYDNANDQIDCDAVENSVSNMAIFLWG